MDTPDPRGRARARAGALSRGRRTRPLIRATLAGAALCSSMVMAPSPGVAAGVPPSGGQPADAPATAAAAVSTSAAADAPLPFDFNGDGFAELVSGVPGEGVGSHDQAGAVAVIPGSMTGPTALGNQHWHQARPGVAGAAESGDRFGAALASADFDSDGYADLAVGIPDEDVGAAEQAGAVQLLFGSAAGLAAQGNRMVHQGSAGVPGRNESGDHFGGSLSAGDFNGDGHPELVVGVLGEALGGLSGAGSLVVLPGTAAGPAAAGATAWNQDSPGVADRAESSEEQEERFGAALAVGDVNADGRDDLAIGVLGESSASGLGAVHLLRGSPGGLTTTGAQFLTAADVAGATLPSHLFGQALATGDFDADGRDDLAIAEPQGSLPGGRFAAGAVAVMYAGGAGGFVRSDSQVWHLDRPDLASGATSQDLFGLDLVAGDVTGDAIADLAVAAPGRTVAGVRGAGTVHVLRGTEAGLVGTPVVLAQGQAGAPGSPGESESCGTSLAISRLGAGPAAWLIAGCPDDAIGQVLRAGSVTVVPGSPGGPVPGAAQLWSQATTDVLGTVEHDDALGYVDEGRLR